MRDEFWVLVLGMFLISFLVVVLPFGIVMFLYIVFWLGIGYLYWENEKEKEERLRRLEWKAPTIHKCKNCGLVTDQKKCSRCGSEVFEPYFEN